jgi:hypothetical protein
VPIASPRYPFTKRSLDRAPSEAGVYALFEGGELVYIGRAGLPAGIQTRLLQHLFGVREPSKATHYAWEICRDAHKRQAELIREFEKTFFRRPRYNGRLSASARRAA